MIIKKGRSMRTVTQRALFIALMLGCSAPAFALPREIVEQVKKVTALVEVRVGKERAFGTAFCIDARGLFITNAHVVEDGHRFNLILCPGESDERKTTAKVLKVNAGMDLALLQIERPGTLKALELGDVSTLFDTMDLTAFGYPFGQALAMSDKDYPSISVSTGHLTSLRKKAGEIELIQLDAVLNPGNSGGPVLDSNGRVIGIVQSGMPGAGINFAIPVSRLQKFLKDPVDSSARPDAPSVPDPGPAVSAPPGDAGGKEWELTSYLKGTAPQIRDKLNGEMERLIVKIRETRAIIKKYNDDSIADEKAAIEAVHKSDAYKQATDEKANAEQALDAARKGGSSQEKLDASSRFNKARMAVEKMEHDAVTNCQPLSQDRHHAYESQGDLKRYTEALDKATAWREELLDAIRTTFSLQGPHLHGNERNPLEHLEGAKGTLPKVTVAKIVDGSHAVVDYELISLDMDHPLKEKEEIKIFNGISTRVKILVSGIDTSKMKQGDKTNLDHTFVVEGRRHSEIQGTIFLAGPSPSEVDALFDAIVPLREQITPGTGTKLRPSK